MIAHQLKGCIKCAPFFSYHIFWRQFVATTVLISSEACPRWNKAYTSIGLRGTGGYLTGSWKIDKWALFFTGKWQAVPYVMWRHAEGCSPLSLSPCVFLFLTPLLFKQASEHLNDQNSATWLSAPALSNLDGYVSASERGRHGRYTDAAHTHTHTYICPQVQRRFCRQANASRHNRQLSHAGKWKNVLLSGDAVSHTAVQKQQLSVQRAKGHSLFIQLSLSRQLWNLKWITFLSSSVLQEITVLK